MTPGPGIEPRAHWWKAGALTTAQFCAKLVYLLTKLCLNKLKRSLVFVSDMYS